MFVLGFSWFLKVLFTCGYCILSLFTRKHALGFGMVCSDSFGQMGIHANLYRENIY